MLFTGSLLVDLYGERFWTWWRRTGNFINLWPIGSCAKFGTQSVSCRLKSTWKFYLQLPFLAVRSSECSLLATWSKCRQFCHGLQQLKMAWNALVVDGCESRIYLVSGLSSKFLGARALCNTMQTWSIASTATTLSSVQHYFSAPRMIHSYVSRGLSKCWFDGSGMELT